MQNKNIDSLMSEKANGYLADNSYMSNDFASIKAQLPTSPTTLLKPSSKPYYFNLNIILGLIAVVTVVTLLFIKNKKSSNKNNSSAPIASNSMLNTIAKDTILIDTPVVVNEIPKDPKIAPKKWVYKMQINFAGKTETKLPPKEIVDIEKIAKEETTKKEDIDSKEKSKIVIQNFLNQLASPTQLFTINNQESHHIICKDGTTLKIAPNTFIDLHKKVVQGNVALEIKEAYSYTDIIGNNLHTVSNGNLLQSGGMVYINATQNRQQLDIDIQNPIQLELPTTNKKDSMQLFNLDKNNWVANGQMQMITNSTNINILATSNLIKTNSYKPVKIDTLYSQNIAKDKVVFSDGLIIKTIGSSLIGSYTLIRNGFVNINNTFIDSAYNTNSKYYNFNIRNFGWINCDKFYKNKNNIDFEVVQNGNQNTLQVSSLAFIKLKTMINGYSNKNNTTIFSQIPENEKVCYIAFQYQNDKVLTCIQQFTTSKETAKASEFIELTPAQVKAKLDALGNVKE